MGDQGFVSEHVSHVVMGDQGFVSEHVSHVVADGPMSVTSLMEAPEQMEVPVQLEAPVPMEDSVAEHQNNGINSGVVSIDGMQSSMEGPHTEQPIDESSGVVPVDSAVQAESFVAEQQIGGNNFGFVDGVGDMQPQPEEPPAPLTEEDRLWNVVNANLADFNAWTLLIQEVDKQDIIERIRRVYDTFLVEYPLCYGYWKKYADHEARLGAPENIVGVYERAVQAVTYSVDIWMHYSTYLMSKAEDPDEIHRVFERGLSYVGSDYLSHLLWDKYLEFENVQNNISGVSQILTRILQLPIQQLDRYYSSFKNLVAAHSLQELQTPEEAAASASAAASAAAAATVSAVAAAESQVVLAESQGGQEGSLGDSAIAPAELEGGLKLEQPTEWSEEAEYAKYVALREHMYKAAKDQDAKIREFESAIRRPYFHVKPLDELQLANWHRYLDFIEKEGDLTKTVKLFERCLIACANYPEYWIRYVQCMEHEGSIEIANDALTRATKIFVKRRPEIHLFAARFKEQHGDISGARSEYNFLNSSLAPGLLESVIKAANFEQRQGDLEAACASFDSAIEYEKSKEESRSLALLFIQYARFLDQVAMKTEKAREVYATALAILPHSKILWEAVIHFESFRPGVKEVNYLDSYVEQATALPRADAASLNAADREEISDIFLEFADLFGDIQAIKKAEARHRQLFPFRRGSSESKKRPSSDSSGQDRAKVLKTYSSSATTVSPAQSGPGAYANGQTQWGSGYSQQGYGQQPQSWQQPPPQQAPQVQQQQWNTGYNTQQAGYNAYGNYGGYGPPQQQVAAPQQQPAAYGGYAQNYAPQTFPQQQSYAQQPVYSQQQAPAQQGYYSGYY